MRPNRLVLPAPFGPTIPTVSPWPMASDSSSAMTTRPNRFVTRSSSSSCSVIRSRVSWLQISGDLRLRLQRVVHDLHLHGELGPLLPLHADGRGDSHTWRRPTRSKVQRSRNALDGHVVDRVGYLGL